MDGQILQGTWSAILTVVSDGTLSGASTLPRIGPVSGVVSCNSITFSTTASSLDVAVIGSVARVQQPGQLGLRNLRCVRHLGHLDGERDTDGDPVARRFPDPEHCRSGDVRGVRRRHRTHSHRRRDDRRRSGRELLGRRAPRNGAGSCTLDEQASISPYTVTADYLGDDNYQSTSTSITNSAAVATGGTVTTGTDQVAAQRHGWHDRRRHHQRGAIHDESLSVTSPTARTTSTWPPPRATRSHRSSSTTATT